MEDIPNNNADLLSANAMLFLRNYAQAELHLRRYLRHGGNDPIAIETLSAVARGFGIDINFRLSENLENAKGDQKRYLLIKAWGYGFWSDVHHVMGQLLIAELTQRIPIVHWGSNSLFRDPEADALAADASLPGSAFDLYFEPVSAMTLSALPVDVSVYPPKWSRNTLSADNLNKWDGPYSRLAAQYLFNRSEDVLVSDFYTTVSSIIPWIGRDSQYHGMTEDQIYNELFIRYARPRIAITARVDAFHQAQMAGRHWVAVHVRGSDKIYESPGLHQTNQRYFSFIDRIIELNPDIGVFLLTDSVSVHADFNERYSNRIVSTPALRSLNNTGVHMQGHSGRIVAEQVMVDALLATRCEYFVGNKESNVSLAIASLKRWPQGFLVMLGDKNGRAENLFLHKQAAIPYDTCRLCKSPVERVFEKELLGQYRVGYHRCMVCKALQTDTPYWLEEAYGRRSECFEVGKLWSTLARFLLLPRLLDILQVRKSDRVVDISDFTGLFARLMRDAGHDFHCCDSYRGTHSLASSASNQLARSCRVVTIFEVAEHFADPEAEWRRIFAANPDFIIGSAALYSGQGADWPHLLPETGRHVFFYSFEAILYLARKNGRDVYHIGAYFIISRTVLSEDTICLLRERCDNVPIKIPKRLQEADRRASGLCLCHTVLNREMAG